MYFSVQRSAVLLSLALLGVNGLVVSTRGDRPVTRVVKMLEDMLAKSEADGEMDRVTFAKFKCYCDSQQKTKNTEIGGLEESIALNQGRIEELLGDTGGLSEECASLRASIAENEESQAQAEKIRGEENQAFLETEKDLEMAIGQMKEAIEVLSNIGADQTLGDAAADHQKFMAGKKVDLIKLNSRVKEALGAASALLSPAQRQKLVSFLQAPFTGTYTSQSGEVVGILKSMRDTFSANLAEARATEEAQLNAFNALMTTLKNEHATMTESYSTKQSALAANDEELASKREIVKEDNSQLATKQAFLAELLPLCQQKSQEYEERKALRTNEDAAITQAIAILNTDAAFAAFGKVKATSRAAMGGEALLQIASVRRHVAAPDTRSRVIALLTSAALLQKSGRLAQVASLLGVGNPFAVVLEEIEKILVLLEKEGTSDATKRTWCRDERLSQNTALNEKTDSITQLNIEIGDLTNEIEAPVTGLKATIAAMEASLLENSKSQESTTTSRKKENEAYQTNVADLQEAQALLKQATLVLKAYYSDLEQKNEADSVTEARVLTGETGAVPTAWESEKGMQGQSVNGDQVIQLLEFISSESQKEEDKAHSDEAAAQKSFEDLMTSLKAAERQLQIELAAAHETLARKEQEKTRKEIDLADTTADAKAIEEYLESIRPGCDFMESHFEEREAHRAAERAALQEAISLIKGTPAYQSAEAAISVEALGACKSVCVDKREHVICKACLAKVTVPAYCAGHPGTEGCGSGAAEGSAAVGAGAEVGVGAGSEVGGGAEVGVGAGSEVAAEAAQAEDAAKQAAAQAAQAEAAAKQAAAEAAQAEAAAKQATAGGL